MRRNLQRIAIALGLVLVGLALFVWRQLRASQLGPPVPICHARPLQRAAFDAPVQLSGAAEGAFDVEPAAVLDGEGDLVVAYMVRSGVFGAGHIGLAKVQPDGGVEHGQYTPDREQAFDVSLARGKRGLQLAFLGHNGGMPERSMEVGYAESGDGLHWTPTLRADDAAHDCPDGQRGCLDKPIIASAGERTVVAYYSEAGDGLKLVQQLPDGGFGESVKVLEGAFVGMELQPSGALDFAYVTWSSGKPDRFGDPAIRVEYLHSPDGKSFGAPVRVSRIDESVPFYFSSPQVLADPQRGLLHVLYPSGSGKTRAWDLVLATSSDGGKSWSHLRVNDDSPCASHMMPFAALDPVSGAVHVAWFENRSGKGGIAYSRCEADGSRCSANEAVSAPFDAFGLGRNSETWLGDYAQLVLDPVRRELHAVWTQTVLEDGKPHGRIFTARGRIEP